MTLTQLAPAKPRKQPVQSRSGATLDAIYDAAIQVLLALGPKRITTTRIAERAGVSVGTLYQYHPNLESVMAAVLKRHLDLVSDATEAACVASHGQTLDEMIHAVIEAFVDAKLSQAPMSKALYAISNDVGGAEVVRQSYERAQVATYTMLQTVSDYHFDDAETAATMIVTARSGPIQAALQDVITLNTPTVLKSHLALLCLGYLKQVGRPV